MDETKTTSTGSTGDNDQRVTITTTTAPGFDQYIYPSYDQQTSVSIPTVWAIPPPQPITQTIHYPVCGCSATGVAPMPVDCPTHGKQIIPDVDKTSEKQEICLAILLDESGSMQSIRQKTIDGLNEYIGKLRSDPNADYVVSLVKFDENKPDPTCRTIYEMQEISKVKDLVLSDYSPRGSTPWYDALGGTIHALESKAKGRPVLLISISDGYENASTEYSLDAIQKLVKEKEIGGNWTFVYLGADINAVTATAGTGWAASGTMSYAAANTQQIIGQTLASATYKYSSVRASMAPTASLRASGGEFFQSTGGLIPQYPHYDPKYVGSLGGQARAASLTPEERSKIAQKAGKQRWQKKAPKK